MYVCNVYSLFKVFMNIDKRFIQTIKLAFGGV